MNNPYVAPYLTIYRTFCAANPDFPLLDMFPEEVFAVLARFSTTVLRMYTQTNYDIEYFEDRNAIRCNQTRDVPLDENLVFRLMSSFDTIPGWITDWPLHNAQELYGRLFFGVNQRTRPSLALVHSCYISCDGEMRFALSQRNTCPLQVLITLCPGIFPAVNFHFHVNLLEARWNPAQVGTLTHVDVHLVSNFVFLHTRPRWAKIANASLQWIRRPRPKVRTQVAWDPKTPPPCITDVVFGAAHTDTGQCVLLSRYRTPLLCSPEEYKERRRREYGGVITMVDKHHQFNRDQFHVLDNQDGTIPQTVDRPLIVLNAHLWDACNLQRVGNVRAPARWLAMPKFNMHVAAHVFSSLEKVEVCRFARMMTRFVQFRNCHIAHQWTRCEPGGPEALFWRNVRFLLATHPLPSLCVELVAILETPNRFFPDVELRKLRLLLNNSHFRIDGAVEVKATSDCAVCLDEPQDPVQLPCTHVFCIECVDKLYLNAFYRCPLCRAPLVTGGRLRIRIPVNESTPLVSCRLARQSPRFVNRDCKAPVQFHRTEDDVHHLYFGDVPLAKQHRVVKRLMRSDLNAVVHHQCVQGSWRDFLADVGDMFRCGTKANMVRFQYWCGKNVPGSIFHDICRFGHMVFKTFSVRTSAAFVILNDCCRVNVRNGLVSLVKKHFQNNMFSVKDFLRSPRIYSILYTSLLKTIRGDGVVAALVPSGVLSPPVSSSTAPPNSSLVSV